MKRPGLWIVAGPNGAGKSTLTRRVLEGKVPVVNPDDIAASIDMANRNTRTVQLAAGRRTLAERAAHMVAGRSFTVETTLTGNGGLDLMRRAQTSGYRVNLIFVGLDDVALSTLRVADRVRKGGHNVPVADLQRRFARSLANLAPALEAADRAWVFDNTSNRLRLLLVRRQEAVRFLTRKLPEWASRAIPNNLRVYPRDRDVGRN